LNSPAAALAHTDAAAFLLASDLPRKLPTTCHLTDEMTAALSSLKAHLVILNEVKDLARE